MGVVAIYLKDIFFAVTRLGRKLASLVVVSAIELFGVDDGRMKFVGTNVDGIWDWGDVGRG